MYKTTFLIKYFTLILFIFLFTNNSFAQKPQSIEKRTKELQEKEEQRKQEEINALKQMQAEHLAIQSKSTKKRMKKSRKKAKNVNDNKRGFSLKRMFKKRGHFN
jgi:peptidoglycan hydrolase CwlO-like protein